ncbi:hypothetical protein [Caulobacter sp.]|uniref:hypothetical protein n=1 Tax=Caulobacter sp. TaxID=78 RepID=UPI003BB0DC60
MPDDVASGSALKKLGLFAAFFLAIALSIWIGKQGLVWAYVGGLGTVAASLAFALLSNRLFRREKIRAPMRRYLLRFGVSISAYVILLVTAVWLGRQGLAEGPWGYVIALAPSVGVLGGIASVGLYLAEETDEFARTTLIQSLLWGTAGTLSVATIWGFLETFDKAPHVPTWATVPVFAVFMGLAQALVARRYR